MDCKNQIGSMMIEFCFLALLLAVAWSKFSRIYYSEIEHFKNQHKFPKWEHGFVK